jgi:hypothetical protein
MEAQIKLGAILIEGKTLLPHTLLFDSERASHGWILVKNLDRYRLERKIRDAGWTLVSVGGDLQAGSYGFSREKTTRKALERVLLRLESRKSNCLEVTAVEFRRVLGVLHVSISARARHITEKSNAFASELSAA